MADPFQLVARESGERLLLSMPETDIPVTIDTERFAWVLSNLVSNALRVGSVGSTVRIVITQEEDDAVLRVEDDGPGIPPELEARLFEPFSHGRTAGTREGLVGLGLAITRDIVEAHGGVIRYARNPGGSHFHRIAAVGEVEEGIGKGWKTFLKKGVPPRFSLTSSKHPSFPRLLRLSNSCSGEGLTRGSGFVKGQ